MQAQNQTKGSGNQLLSLPARKTIIDVLDQIIGRVELEISASSNIEKTAFLRLPFLSRADTKTQGDAILTFDLLKRHQLFQNKFKFVGIAGIEKIDKDLKWNNLVDSLNEFKREILTNRKPSSDAIMKLTLVLPKSEHEKKYKIVINEKYEDPIEVDSIKPTWQLLLEIAKSQFVQISGSSDKSTFDYLNSNKRCRLYTKTGYSITQILKMDHSLIKAAIPIEAITERQYHQTLNKIRT